MFELRDYQKEAAEKGIEFFRDGLEKDHPIIVQPTGGGKSVVAAYIAKELKTPTMIFQPSKELLEQNYSKFTAYGGEASIYSASMGMKEIGHTTFATIGSVKSIPHLFDHVRNIIIDECHLVPPEKGSMFMRFLSQLSGVKVIGLTATAFRLKKYVDPFSDETYSQINLLNRERPRYFNDFLHITQIKELYDKGYLSPVRYIELEWDGTSLRVNTTGAEYTEASMDYAMKQQKIIERLPGIVRQSVEKGRRHRVVFVKNVEDAVHLASITPKAACVHAGTNKRERDQILSKFKAGEILTVYNVNVLTIGFDFPALDTIIIARPTMSLAMFMQMVGRGIRPHLGKKDCVVVDMCGNVQRFSPLEQIVYDIGPDGKWRIHDDKKVLSGVRLDGEKTIYL